MVAPSAVVHRLTFRIQIHLHHLGLKLLWLHTKQNICCGEISIEAPSLPVWLVFTTTVIDMLCFSSAHIGFSLSVPSLMLYFHFGSQPFQIFFCLAVNTVVLRAAQHKQLASPLKRFFL